MTRPDSWETLGDVVFKVCTHAREEVRAAIESRGFDGLFNDAGECGCGVEDLYPCGEPSTECCLGVREPCPSSCGDHDFHIVPGVPHPPERKASGVVVKLSPSGGRPTCAYLSDGTKIVVRRDSGTVGAAWLEYVVQDRVTPAFSGAVPTGSEEKQGG